MRLDVDIDTSLSEAFVRAVHSDQLPFATSVSVNRTAICFQGEERAHLHEIFKLRRVQFAERAIRIKRGDFATKRKPEAKVRVEAAGGKSDIFAKFETETEKLPFRGRSVAVPTSNVPLTAGGIIPKRFRPSQLFKGATQHGHGKVFRTKGNVLRGKQNTFLIRRPGGKGTIFQRQTTTATSGRSGGSIRETGIVALYQLVPRVQIKPELEFIETARKVVRDRWPAEFARAWHETVLSASPGRAGPRRARSATRAQPRRGIRPAVA